MLIKNFLFDLNYKFKKNQKIKIKKEKKDNFFFSFFFSFFYYLRISFFIIFIGNQKYFLKFSNLNLYYTPFVINIDFNSFFAEFNTFLYLFQNLKFNFNILIKNYFLLNNFDKIFNFRINLYKFININNFFFNYLGIEKLKIKNNNIIIKKINLTFFKKKKKILNSFFFKTYRLKKFCKIIKKKYKYINYSLKFNFFNIFYILNKTFFFFKKDLHYFFEKKYIFLNGKFCNNKNKILKKNDFIQLPINNYFYILNRFYYSIQLKKIQGDNKFPKKQLNFLDIFNFLEIDYLTFSIFFLYLPKTIFKFDKIFLKNIFTQKYLNWKHLY